VGPRQRSLVVAAAVGGCVALAVALVARRSRSPHPDAPATGRTHIELPEWVGEEATVSEPSAEDLVARPGGQG
jgi:hypothetical protein